MELSTELAVGSFIMAIPQAVAGAVFLADRFAKKSSASRVISKGLSLTMAVVMVAGGIGAAALGTWIYFHPIQPTYVDRVIEKATPCPITQQKNGNATARGTNANAHSGNGDTFSSPPPIQKPPK